MGFDDIIYSGTSNERTVQVTRFTSYDDVDDASYNEISEYDVHGDDVGGAYYIRQRRKWHVLDRRRHIWCI